MLDLRKDKFYSGHFFNYVNVIKQNVSVRWLYF